MIYKKEISSSYHDCDCCGSYDSGYCTITLNKKHYHLSYDGHFGGGCWDGDDKSIPFHVVGIIHGTTRVNIEDPEWSWGVFSHDDTTIKDNQCSAYNEMFWREATSVNLEIKNDDFNYQFFVNGELIFNHDIFVKLFGEELNLHYENGYMNERDMWYEVVELYISNLE